MKFDPKSFLAMVWSETYIAKKLQARADAKKKKQIEEFVGYIQSLGLSVVKLKTVAGVQYIEALDGSWRRVGGRTEDPDVKGLLKILSSKPPAAKKPEAK